MRKKGQATRNKEARTTATVFLLKRDIDGLNPGMTQW